LGKGGVATGTKSNRRKYELDEEGFADYRGDFACAMIAAPAGIQIYTARPNGKGLHQITYLSGDALAPA
jgi:hypothetical protein